MRPSNAGSKIGAFIALIFFGNIFQLRLFVDALIVRGWCFGLFDGRIGYNCRHRNIWYEAICGAVEFGKCDGGLCCGITEYCQFGRPDIDAAAIIKINFDPPAPAVQTPHELADCTGAVQNRSEECDQGPGASSSFNNFSIRSLCRLRSRLSAAIISETSIKRSSSVARISRIRSA